MRGRAAVWVTVIGLLAGCSGSRRPDGAPDPLACTADDQCRAGPLVNPDEPCCDTGVELSVFSQAYLEWRGRWKQEACADVECPVLPSPSRPMPCALIGRCVEGRCTGSCDREAAGPDGTGGTPSGGAPEAAPPQG